MNEPNSIPKSSDDRLLADWQILDQLARGAGFWVVKPIESTDSEDGSKTFQVEIDGKAIADPGSGQNPLVEKQLMRIELDLDFPQSPPQIIIESPVFHPNLAADGIVSVEDLGLTWQTNITLDIVLERLWNTLRGSHVDLENVINTGAAKWYGKQHSIALPVDSRTLAGPEVRNRNIVRYRRRGEQFRRFKASEPIVISDENSGSPDLTAPDDSPIHFID